MLSKLFRPVWTGVVILVIVAAFLVSLARVLLPLVSHYRSDIEEWIHNVMGYPVQIGQLDAVWKGFSPTLELKEVSLRDPTGAAQLFVFDDVSIELDIFRSLINRRVEPGAVVLRGLKLTVERNAGGALALAGIVATSSVKDTGPTDPRLTEWFLSRRVLSLEDAEVTWHDQLQGRAPVTFTDVDLILANSGGIYRVAGSGELPAVFGRRLDIRAQFFGNPAKSSGWRGETYVRARGVKLAEWYRGLPKGPYDLVKGIADAELWSVWVDGRLQQIDGELSAYAVEVSNKSDERMGFDALSSRVKWQRDDKGSGWTLLLSRFMMAFDNHAWVPTSIGITYSSGEDVPVWQISAEHLVVQDVLRLSRFVAGPDVMPALAEKVRPRGDVFDVYGRVRGKGEDAKYFFRCRAQDFATTPVDKLPGMTGMDAVVYADNDHVLLNLIVEKARLEFPRLFRQPLELERVTGAVVAEKSNEGWLLWSDDLNVANSDLSSRAALELELPREGVPQIDLVVTYGGGRGERASAYYPVGIMKPPLVEWLDRAVVGGQVVDGGLVLRGPLNKFPFRGGEGRFEVRFSVQDGRLAYMPGWPTLTQLDAEVVFSQQGLRARASRGKSLGADITSAQVEIEDLGRNPELRVTGRASGSAAEGWKHLTDSPLRNLIGEFVASANVSGQAELDLALNLPLHDHLPLGIDGKVTARNVGMVFGDTTPLDITAVNGQVGFSERGLSAKALKANVLGQPATVGISTGEGEFGKRPLVFAADGALSIATLRRRLPFPVLGYADGATRWQGTLTVMPLASRRNSELKIESDLQGVSLSLPAPVGKLASGMRPLQLSLGFGSNKAWPLRFTYGDSARGDVLLEQEQGAWSVARGVIHYGTDTAPLVDRQVGGLQVVARLGEVKLDEYLALGGEGPSSPSKPPFSRIALAATNAQLWGQAVSNLEMAALRSGAQWTIDLSSDRAKGRLAIPTDFAAPINADLSYLRVHTGPAGEMQTQKTESGIDPRRLRAVEFKAQEFTLGELQLGAARGAIVKAPGGMRLSDAELTNGPTRMHVDGSWTFDGKNGATVLNAALESSNFGETLSQLGYANTIREGEGTADLKVRWRGSPMDYDGSRLNGDIRILVSKGQVLEVEPGAGRILGILSVQSLPRRLTLDFSDVFAKGFAFDKIDGQFTARDGVATIDAFELRGPSAYISIAGQIDLGRKTYEQRVKVIPNLTGNLPIAIGVIAGSPVAGAAVWLADKVFRRPIGDLTQVNYRVTGPWQQPVVERLTREDLVEEERAAGTQ